MSIIISTVWQNKTKQKKSNNIIIKTLSTNNESNIKASLERNRNNYLYLQ
jgi:hypothetical protein